MTDHFRVAVHCVGKKGVKDPFRASCSLWREERCEGLPPEQAVHCGGKKGVKNTFRASCSLWREERSEEYLQGCIGFI